MIKQPTQPLRFFSSYLEIEHDWNKRDHGNPGTHVITEDILFIPPFQIKFDWRDALIDDFFHRIFLFNYDTGAYTDITADIRAWGISGYAEYQNLVMYRFPLWTMADPGNYYLRISDGALGGTTITELWFSEVFKLCDLSRNLLTEFTGSAGWNTFQVSDAISTRDVYYFRVCESGASADDVYSNYFYATKDEPLDFYIYGHPTDLACGDDTFLPLQFSLVDAGGTVVSDIIDAGMGCVHYRLTPTKTTTVRLLGQNLSVNGKSEWFLYMYHANPQLYNEVWAGDVTSEVQNIGSRKVIRWSNSRNICDMVYEEQTGYNHNGDSWTLSYENYLILDDPPLIPDFSIFENAAENDKSDKALLLGAQQEWYYLQLATNSNLAKAIQFIHLMSTVEIAYNGEKHVVCENISETSAGDDYNFTVKFRFREVSCPVQSCGFTVCCPNLLPVQDVLAAVGALPAAGSTNAGLRYLVLDGGVYYIYESDGDAWNQLPDLNAAGNCIYDLSGPTDTPYMYWDDINGNWYRLVYISSVHDDGGSVAEYNLRNYSKPGLKVIASWIPVAGGVRQYSAEFTLDGSASEQIHVTTAGGGVQYAFILYIWDGDCYYGESNGILQTIA